VPRDIPEGYKIIPGLEHLMINESKQLKSVASGKDIPVVRLSKTGVPLYLINKNYKFFVRDADSLHKDAYSKNRNRKQREKARA